MKISEVNVDLLETFNWLIGITVQGIAAPQTFIAEFDPDAEGRLGLKGRLRQDLAGPWWFRTVTGTKPDGRHALIIWRKLTGEPEQDNLVLDTWFTRAGYSAKDSEFGLIYVNGDNNLENLKAADDTWKVRSDRRGLPPADVRHGGSVMARAATNDHAPTGEREDPRFLLFTNWSLNQWLLSLFDVKRFEQLAEHLRSEKLEGMDENNVHHFHHALMAQLFNLTKLPTELLLEYDQNIVKHTQRLNERRITRGEAPIIWKYFQYLTLLFTEIYLDRYFRDPRRTC